MKTRSRLGRRRSQREGLRSGRLDELIREATVDAHDESEAATGFYSMFEERRRQQAAQKARENARREREEAEAREVRLNALAKREGEAWQQVEALIATKLPHKYHEAMVLLRDLDDVCVRAGRQAEVTKRIERLREEHATKRSFIARLRDTGLIA
jgi:hypothetical protein